MKHRLAVCALTWLSAALPVAAGELSLTVTGFADDRGMARIVVMNGPEEYAGASPVSWIATVPISGGRAVWTADLTDGDFAFIAHHDRDGVDALDRTVFGLPLEPYGYSGGAWTSFGLPDYADAAFVMAGDDVQTVRLRMNAFATIGQVGAMAVSALLVLLCGVTLHRRATFRGAPQSHLMA